MSGVDSVLKSSQSDNPDDAIAFAFMDGVVWATVHGPITQEFGDALVRKARTAIVCAVRNNGYAFLESAAMQRGLPIKVFTDGARAQAWLHENTDR
jgi:hypothetical protein